jgi:GNAT superfamily N-acetyltransferase
VDAELVGSLLEFYRSAADVANLHFAPSVLPADWDAICGSFGLTAGTTLVKTVRETGPVEPVETSLRIGPIESSEADAWGAVQIEAFELPDPTGGFAAMLASFAGLPQATAYGAWDGDKLVATGGLYIWNGVGECVSGSTLPAYRGRGAQTALLARRLEDAFAAGCEWASSETGKPAPGQHNASLANMERVGFKVLYDRRSYRWTA